MESGHRPGSKSGFWIYRPGGLNGRYTGRIVETAFATGLEVVEIDWRGVAEIGFRPVEDMSWRGEVTIGE